MDFNIENSLSQIKYVVSKKTWTNQIEVLNKIQKALIRDLCILNINNDIQFINDKKIQK